MRMKADKDVSYVLYVGFGMSRSALSLNGDKYKFTSGRARAEFVRILKKENPTSAEQVKILYQLFTE